MNKVQILKAIDGKVSTAKFASLKAKQLPFITTFYKDLLIGEIASLGLPNEITASFSIARLEAIAKQFDVVKKEIVLESNKVSKASKRQNAVINAVVGLTFPCEIATYKDAVIANYANAYFNLNGASPQSYSAVKFLYVEGLITVIDGVDEKTVFADLVKNGNFAGANAYSTSHKLGTHLNDVFDFTLTKVGKTITMAKKA